MHISKLLVLSAMAASLTLAQADEKKSAPATKPAAQQAVSQATVDLTVTGMVWGVNCVKKVRSALTSVPGVSKAEVTMPDKAVVTYDKSKAKEADLIQAVKKAGSYSASVKKAEKI